MNDEKFTRFPNELFDWLLARSNDLSKREIVVILAVIRNTIGWRREECRLSCRFIAKATNLDPANVSKAIHELEKKELLLVDRSTGTAVISFNHAVVKLTTAVVETTTPVLLNQPQDSGQIDNASVVKLTTNKESERQIKDKNNTEADEFAGLF